MSLVYLDNNATTPVDPRVLDAMLPYFREDFGNAASRYHRFGETAKAAVTRARRQVAELIGADENEIIWTSGATEGNNAALQGVARMYVEQGRHIITSPIEHKAVVDPCKFLETEGFEVTWLRPDRTGRVSAAQVAEAIRTDTILVSLMFANNEIGTLNPVDEIGAVCKDRSVFFHSDATQAVGKIPVNVGEMGVDLLTISAHKMYGPKGVGALYVRRKNPRVRLQPIIYGGGHERGMRSGTLNVPGIVGCGVAAQLAKAELTTESERLRSLRDRLWDGLSRKLDFITMNGSREHGLPGTLNVSFLYVEGESLMLGMKDIAVSSGSACTSASLEPSYVLRGIGVGDDVAHTSIRFSLGRFTTEEEIDRAIAATVKAVRRLREMSPLYEMALEGVNPADIEWRSP